MPLPNPSQAPKSAESVSPESTPEEVITSWTEPERVDPVGQLSLPTIYAIGAVLVALLIVIGVWQKDFTYYLGAGVIATACLAVYSQRRHPIQPLDIIFTTQRLQVGQRLYAISDLAGFWLSEENNQVYINIEPKKAAPLPITFLFPDESMEAARTNLSQLLPEVEPRSKSAIDGLNRYLKI